MSYGRDPHARHRGVGAVAAADHLRGRTTKRQIVARATARRDAQLAGLTYGRTGGLSGFGALESLGAINTSGTPMQNPRRPVINGGGGLDTPPAPPRGGNPYNPTIVTKPPQVYVPPSTPPPFVPPRKPVGPLIGGVRPSVTTVAVPGAGGGSVLCSRLDAMMGRCGTSGGGGVKPGSTTTDTTGGSTTTGGGGGGGDGAGAGLITGGDPGVVFQPPPDVPDAPAASSTIVGLTPTGVVVAGGLVLGGLYLLMRKK